jgi:hypothetical protein
MKIQIALAINYRPYSFFNLCTCHIYGHLNDNAELLLAICIASKGLTGSGEKEVHKLL